MIQIANAVCYFSFATIAIVGCGRTNDSNPMSSAATEETTEQNASIVGRWQTKEADSADRTIWEFTEDGRVKSGSVPELTGTFTSPNSDILVIAWDDMEAGKVTFKVRITEHRHVPS